MSVISLGQPEAFNSLLAQACDKRRLGFISADELSALPQSELLDCELLLVNPVDLEKLHKLLSHFNESVSWVLVSPEAKQAKRAIDELGAADTIDSESLPHSLDLALLRWTRFASLKKENHQLHEKLGKAMADLELNHDMLRQDLHAGRMIQQRMLPETPWKIADAMIEHAVIPSLYLSGDYVEYLPLNESKVLLLIADVSGHGSSSAFITVLLKNQMARVKMIVDENHHELQPEWVLENINNELLAMEIDKHVTAIAAVIDFAEDTIVWSVAGHLPGPLLTLENDGKLDCHFLPGEGFPLGLFASASYTSQTARLTTHFSLSLFSDGVLELGSKGKDLSARESYLASIQNDRIFSLQDWQRELGLRSVVEPSDDITLLIVSR